MRRDKGRFTPHLPSAITVAAEGETSRFASELLAPSREPV